MAQRSVLPASQRRALARLSELPIADELYLAGGVAIAIHLGHRTSLDLDVVRYPYPLLVKPRRHETGVRVASLRDLAPMKLAAIARRGLRRDYWDLHTILTSSRSTTLARVLEDYKRKFGVAESDVYHVLRSLSWFDDACASAGFIGIRPGS